MTRAHARATETEVDSFLFKLHSVSYESRVLPQIETLCLVRYQGDDREDARTEIQATMEKEERTRREKKERLWTLRVPGHFGPGGPAPPWRSSSRPRVPGLQPRVPGLEAPGARPKPPSPLHRPRVPGPESPGCPHHTESLRASLGLCPCIPPPLLFRP